MRVQTRKETYEDRFARKYYCNADRFTSKMKRENRRQLRRTLKALQEHDIQEYSLITVDMLERQKGIYEMLELNNFYNMDCMEGMKQFPDKYFELAIVDPPYGIGISSNPVRQAHTKKQWDSNVPDLIYFKELKRVSKNQIIWGGNYYDLPPTQNYIVWNKLQPMDFSLAMCELAWCSIQKPIKMFTYSVLTERNKIHPTQKPVALYKWLLMNYAKEGDLILDTHVGSASSLIACYDMGFDYVGFEIDEDYYESAVKRIEENKNQLRFEFNGKIELR